MIRYEIYKIANEIDILYRNKKNKKKRYIKKIKINKINPKYPKIENLI
jgi:hypothetical protein